MRHSDPTLLQPHREQFNWTEHVWIIGYQDWC
jgi:hypothetical protein